LGQPDAFPSRQRQLDDGAEKFEVLKKETQAGLDEGILLLSLHILVYIDNPY
jgi:hypothetical protein